MAAGNVANLTNMGKGRAKGSKNKNTLSFTKVMNETIAKDYAEITELVKKSLLRDLKSDDPKVSNAAIKILLDKFFISAEKDVESDIEEAIVINAEEQRALLLEVQAQINKRLSLPSDGVARTTGVADTPT